MMCQYGCGLEYFPGHYGTCKKVVAAFVDVGRTTLSEFQIEDVTEYILSPSYDPRTSGYRCKVLKGKRVCKVKDCGKEALPKLGFCSAHMKEKDEAMKIRRKLSMDRAH